MTTPDELTRLREEVARLTRERDEARALYQEAQFAIDKMEAHDAPYVDCLCSGCPRKVPQAWVSGMCQPCGEEDCEHTDGAKATAEELRQLAALNDAHAALIERLVGERNALRAAIAPTAANVEALARVVVKTVGDEGDWTASEVDDLRLTLGYILRAINERAKL